MAAARASGRVIAAHRFAADGDSEDAAKSHVLAAKYHEGEFSKAMDSGDHDLPALHSKAGHAHRLAALQHGKDAEDEDADDDGDDADGDADTRNQEEEFEEVCDPESEEYDPILCQELTDRQEMHMNQNQLRRRIKSNLYRFPGRKRRPTTNAEIPTLATVSLVPQGPERFGHTHNASPLHYSGLADPSVLADVSINFGCQRSMLTTNTSLQDQADPLVLPEQVLNWAAVSRENRSNYFSRNRKAEGSYADVRDDAAVADQVAQRRRDEGSLDDPACVAEEDDDGITNPGDHGQHGGYSGYWAPKRTVGSEDWAREMQDESDELHRENLKRMGLDEDLQFPYRGDSKMQDMFGSTMPPLGMSSKQFVEEHVTHPDTGRIGYERTTRYGSGDRDEVKRPRPAYTSGGQSHNQAQQLFAGAPDNQFVRNMKAAAMPYGGGFVANADYGEIPALDEPTINWKQLSNEWHNRDRR
jgi:hypothetical protein